MSGKLGAAPQSLKLLAPPHYLKLDSTLTGILPLLILKVLVPQLGWQGAWVLASALPGLPSLLWATEDSGCNGL